MWNITWQARSTTSNPSSCSTHAEIRSAARVCVCAFVCMVNDWSRLFLECQTMTRASPHTWLDSVLSSDRGCWSFVSVNPDNLCSAFSESRWTFPPPIRSSNKTSISDSLRVTHSTTEKLPQLFPEFLPALLNVHFLSSTGSRQGHMAYSETSGSLRGVHRLRRGNKHSPSGADTEMLRYTTTPPPSAWRLVYLNNRQNPTFVVRTISASFLGLATVKPQSPKLHVTYTPRKVKFLKMAAYLLTKKHWHRGLSCLPSLGAVSTGYSFLGAFAQLRKATINFITSVRPSVRLSWNNSAPIGRILIKFHKSSIRKPVEKIQVSLKSEKNNWYFTLRRFHIYDKISPDSSHNKKYFR